MAAAPYDPNATPGSTTSPFGDVSSQMAQQMLTRAQWDQARTELMPLQDRLLSMYTNPNSGMESAQAAAAASAGNVDASLRAAQRRLEGLGVPLTAAQQSSAKRSANLANGLSTVSALNIGKRADDAIKTQIAGIL